MPGKEPVPYNNDSKKILVVDDDIAVTNYIMMLLMQTGRFEPMIVNDSRELPVLFETSRFDAMLLDIDMPGLDGIVVLKMVRERRLGLPVIVLTGVSDAELAVRAMKCGASDYLIKPVEDESLIETLDHSLRACRGGDDFVPRTLTEMAAEHAVRSLAYFGGDREKTAGALGIVSSELDEIIGRRRRFFRNPGLSGPESSSLQ